jgi:spore coat polysaccharide biosynthesis predicted glycosyltransferase SpsG
MDKNILILTESGTQIGMGHITRCLSIAQEFQKQGWNVRILLDSDVPNPDTQLIKMCIWSNWDALLPNLNWAIMVLIDSYRISLAYFEKIYSCSRNTAIIDDSPHRLYSNGIVIDWTIGAEKNSTMKHGVIPLLGIQYCALRTAFQTPVPRTINKNISSVMITFGGSDVRKLTFPFVHHFTSYYPDIAMNVVVGPGCQDVQRLLDFKCPNLTIHSNCNDIQMASIMKSVDIAVCGGGQTLYELVSQSVPSFAVCLVADQMQDISGFANENCVVFVADWNDEKLFEKFDKLVDKYRSFTSRNKLAENCKRQIDGNGVRRLVAKLNRVCEGVDE